MIITKLLKNSLLGNCSEWDYDGLRNINHAYMGTQYDWNSTLSPVLKLIKHYVFGNYSKNEYVICYTPKKYESIIDNIMSSNNNFGNILFNFFNFVYIDDDVDFINFDNIFELKILNFRER